MNNKVTFGNEATKKLLEGIKILTDAVGTTLGPRGRNVSIDRDYEVVSIHDGVTVANEIDLKDKIPAIGAKILKQAAQKQVEEVGDGTTAVIILSNAIIQEAHKIIATGVNPMSLRADLERGRDKVLKSLTSVAIPINTLEEKVQIATISAEDPALGKMIGETINQVGTEGVVTVEESKSSETLVEHQDGMQFENGFISFEFITDPVKLEATIENADILISERNVTNILELKPFLDKYTLQGRNLVVLAPDVTDSALHSFVLTKLNGGMNLLCVKAPSFGAKQKDWLQDIAILTGATVVSEAASMRFENLEPSILGKADRVTSNKDTTIIVGGKGDKTALGERIDALKLQLEKEDSEFEQEKLRERIAKLTGGVAVIKVGGHTQVEMKERKERAIDAVAATKAAVEEGVTPGGEVVYLHARKELDLNNIGEKILFNALEKPFVKLLSNAGLSSEVKLNELNQTVITKNEGFGVDVTDGEIKNLLKAGIIDPVKVAKSAINNAVSVAVQLISIDAVITKVEDKPNGNSSR